MSESDRLVERLTDLPQMVTCPRCNGEGETYDPWKPQYEHADGSERAAEPCDLCSAYGEVTPGVKRWYKRRGK